MEDEDTLLVAGCQYGTSNRYMDNLIGRRKRRPESIGEERLKDSRWRTSMLWGNRESTLFKRLLP